MCGEALWGVQEVAYLAARADGHDDRAGACGPLIHQWSRVVPANGLKVVSQVLAARWTTGRNDILCFIPCESESV